MTISELIRDCKSTGDYFDLIQKFLEKLNNQSILKEIWLQAKEILKKLDQKLIDAGLYEDLDIYTLSIDERMLSDDTAIIILYVWDGNDLAEPLMTPICILKVK